ncbi:MAG TPA: amidase family protein [Bacillota bacterium]|nr:amidase family protein [Bacillota bacterium]HPZ11426.1 amidase family protein [Bacillota bacterium]HQE09608.1 amidase family protein [Bacillota bacterium]
MTRFPYQNYDAAGLAELVQKKEVTAAEIVESAIARLERLNPKINAVIHKMYEKARLAAEKITGKEPFAGVPMLVKDISQEIKGEPITCGAKSLRDCLAEEDATFVKRARATGVVFLGITNVPEFALMGTTEPKYYGPTRNPWNKDYTPGGSSGGSAAAVAAGIVPIAGANDGGGSIRIPAAYCGLFGLKPSRGRMPAGPFSGRHWQGASVDHVLTRSVRDSALMLDLIKGYEAGAAFPPPPFDHNYLECVSQGPINKLKIAFCLRSPIGTEVHRECREAAIKAAQLLESLGHIVDEKEAPVDGNKIAQSYMTLYFGEVAADIASLEEVLGRKARMNDVEPATWMLGLLGKVTSSAEWVLSIREWDTAAFEMEAFFEDYDLYMTPTTADPPSRIGEQDMAPKEATLIKLVSSLNLIKAVKKSGFVDNLIKRSLKRTPFTQLANLTGQPAMSVPLHMTMEGLPVGVQFIAAKGREDILYRLAGQLEQSQHWIRVEENPMFKAEIDG